MSESKIEFNDLLSNDEVERDSSFDALDDALTKDRIRNIGITGNYGSGKSSFIDTYIKGKSKELNFLRISLASFSNDSKINQENREINKENANEVNNTIEQNDSGNKSQAEENEDIVETIDEGNEQQIKKLNENELKNIEISILQQMLYKKNADILPNSRFSRIRKTDKNKVIKYVEQISLFVLILFLFLFPNYLLDEITLIKFNFSKPIVLLIRILLLIPLCHIGNPFLVSIISKINNISLKSISIKDAEFEIENNTSDSILNKRLDEILYFFEMTDYDVVVFEDLDRFNSNEIFVHLREINSIINDYENIHRRIRFIYAVKDQMFLTEERVKFFDFIIPIIPILNSSNAASELIKNQREKNKEYFEGISDSYFTEVGTYINDMRLLKNVVNEYLLYHSKLNPSQKNEEKLFSLILYKNLFPEDFSKMQRKSGDIELAFNWKRRIAKKLKDGNNSKINEYQEVIEKIKKEFIKNISELKLIYLTEYIRQQGLNVDTNQIYKLSYDKSFLDTKFDATFMHAPLGYSPRPINFDYSYFEKISINGFSYANRKKTIDNGITIEKNHYYELIRKENDSQKKLFMMPFSEIFKRASVEDKKQLHLNKQQLYFLRRDLIDENYIDYISLFKEGVLNITENNFINSVRIKDEMPAETSLSNIPVICERIKGEFINNSPALLNFDLLNYLLVNTTEYETQLRLLLNQIIDENNLVFLNNYIEHNESEKYFNLSIEFVDDFLNKLLARANTENDINKYCYLILKTHDPQIKELISKNSKLILFINSHPEILRLLKNSDNNETILNNMKYLKICFESLDNEGITNTFIFDYIISNNLFKLNKQNLYLITKQLDNSNDGIYSKILKSNNQNLINYVNQNITILVKEVLLESNEICEDDDAIIQLLNSEQIVIDDKYEIIKKIDKQISFVDKIINPDLYDSLYMENKVFPTWENIYHYYEMKNTISDILVSYIKGNENYKKIGEEEFDDKHKFKEEYSSFATLLYQDKNISIEQIESMEKNDKYYVNDFDYTKISLEKLEKLIETKSIEFSQKNIEILRNIKPEFSNKFVFNNKAKYLKAYSDYDLNYSELAQFIYDEKLPKNSKTSIFEKTLILQNNLDKLCSKDVRITLLDVIEAGNLFERLNKQNVLNLLQSKDFFFGIDTNKKRIKKRILLLSKTNALFDNNELLKQVIDIEDDFEKLNTHKTVTIDDKEGIFIPICDVLKNRQIIHSYKTNNGKILIKIK